MALAPFAHRVPRRDDGGTRKNAAVAGGAAMAKVAAATWFRGIPAQGAGWAVAAGATPSGSCVAMPMVSAPACFAPSMTVSRLP